MRINRSIQCATALLCLLVLGLGTQAAAQTQYELFAGRLVDTNRLPLVGTITINGVSKVTAADGTYEFYVPYATKYVVRASKAGYVSTSLVTDTANDQLEIRLTRAELFTVNPTSLISVTDSRGTSISIDANSLVDAQGRLATGSLQLSMYTYDLRNDQMVGDMTGIDSTGQVVALQSIGAFVAEFTDAAGNKYNLAAGRRARISLRADPANTFSGSIPLWHYDEARGVWVEEAVGQVQNGVATGEVPHFSAWNFDVKFEAPSCIRLNIDPTYFYGAPNYGMAMPVRVVVPPPWYRNYTLWVNTPGPHVLYNLPNGVNVEFYVNNQPYAIVNTGGAWGGSGIPPRPYNSCQGSLLVNATPKVGRLQGAVLRQYRSNHGGVTVSVSSSSGIYTAATDAAGQFSLLVPAVSSSVTAARAGHLSASRNNVSVAPGATMSLPTVTLLGGEATGDTCINTADMSAIINGIGLSASSSDTRDVNGNGLIWYDDLNMASANGGQCGPRPW